MQTIVRPHRHRVAPKALPFFARNEADWERAIRVMVGVTLLWLGWGGVVTGTAGAVLKVVGFVPLLTGVFGWCGLYALLGFSTKR